MSRDIGTETSFTHLVGCRLPIQQAGMGGASTPELVTAVAESGALGMMGMPMCRASELVAVLEGIETTTTGVFGINFLVPFLDPEAVDVAAAHTRVVEFFYGDPDAELVSRVHAGGALASWQVGSELEAQAASDAGCDLVVAQGTEAGGHVRGKVSLVPLLETVLGRVEVPVIAAGGIGTSRSVKAVIAAGAAAARIGTRFLAAHEADVHPDYLASLISAKAEDTVLTEAFSVGWPDAPHRVLRDCVAAAGRLEDDPVGETELPDGRRLSVPRFAPLPPGRATTGHIRAMALYAGQSVGDVRERRAAREIVEELASELATSC
ncbi:MAG: NAD(P)H-dependent flavin oxidoreductase [Acidimicrobiales bacterium]